MEGFNLTLPVRRYLVPTPSTKGGGCPHTHHRLIIKAAKLVSVFEAEIDHPLGLLKVKAGNLRGILLVVRVKLQNSHHINILAMENRLPWQQKNISISQLSDMV